MSDPREVKLILTERHLTREGLNKFGPDCTHVVVAFGKQNERVRLWSNDAVSYDVYNLDQVNPPPYVPKADDVVQVIGAHTRRDCYGWVRATGRSTDAWVEVEFGDQAMSVPVKNLVKIGEKTSG